MNNDYEAVSDADRITDFTCKLHTWAIDAGRASTGELADAYKALYPLLKKTDIQPQELLTEFEPYSFALEHLATTLRQVKSIYGKKDRMLDPALFHKGLDIYKNAVSDELLETARTPNRREIAAQVKAKMTRPETEAGWHAVAGMIETYNDNLRFITKTILQSMDYVTQEATDENHAIRKASRKLATAWAWAAESRPDGEADMEKQQRETRFKTWLMENEGMSSAAVNTLLGKEGLEYALDQLEIALRQKNAVVNMQTINAQLRGKIGETVSGHEPAGIQDITEDELLQKKNAAIAQEPLILRYEQIKKSIVEDFGRAVQETLDRHLGGDREILQACGELAAAVTLESFHGKEDPRILQLYMNIQEKDSNYMPGLGVQDYTGFLDTLFSAKNMGDHARREVMRKLACSVAERKSALMVK